MTKKKLRLCYYGDPKSIHTTRWISFFASRGHDVHLINDSGAPSSIDGVTVHDFSLTTRRPPFRWIQHWYKLWGLLRHKIRPEVLHAHSVTNYGYWSALMFFHPFVLTPWGSDILLTAKESAFHRLASRFAVKTSDLVTVESGILRKEIVALGADPRKIRQVLWGVDFEQPGDRESSDLIRRELGIPDSGLVILSMRHFRPLYNHAIILKAVPRILERLPSAFFLFVGSGEQRAELEELADKLGITGRVRIIGQQPHRKVRDLMGLADIFISIPSSDSISTTLLEAMASGKPVIVSDIPANREWVTDGESGLVIRPEPGAVTEAVVALGSDKSLLQALGSANRERVGRDADHYANMLKMEELYIALATGSFWQKQRSTTEKHETDHIGGYRHQE